MRLTRTAIGLAAMGAGLLVARAMSSRRTEGFSTRTVASPEPPSPNQLIGTPESHLSAVEASEAFRASRDRPI